MTGDSIAPDARDLRWSALMAAAQQGDSRSYDRLLHEILPHIRSIARARLRGSAEVEDAVQETLLSLHALRHTYDPARPFRPWLNAVAERRAIDQLRRRGRRQGREEVLDDQPETAFATEATGTTRLEAEELRRAVADLPPSQRQALLLAKLEQRPLKEAAEISGLSVGALKVATHRAIAALRARFDGDR
jgi:RNA polymerase sigma-70 factor (ECF subfamily)